MSMIGDPPPYKDSSADGPSISTEPLVVATTGEQASPGSNTGNSLDLKAKTRWWGRWPLWARVTAPAFVLVLLVGTVVIAATRGPQGSQAKSSHSTHAVKTAPQTVVPDFIGMTGAQAKTSADSWTLDVIVPSDEMTWTVDSQSPVAQSSADQGSFVTLHFVAPPVAVPNLVGLTADAASAALSAVGLHSSVASTEHDWLVGTQSPQPGTSVPVATSVLITLIEPPQFDTYTVTGNGTANIITYSTGGTGSSQDSDARLPWTKQIPAGGSFLYVSAQDGSGTSITCTITGPDGAVLATNTATGRYAIATCDN